MARSRKGRHICVSASVGVHPNTEHEVREPTVDELVAEAAAPFVVAIGEPGLDYFRSAGDYVSTAVYRRDLLKNGNLIQGPALVEEHASTTVVLPGDALEVDDFGNLVITIGRSR